jgi:V/A-type H+-transporting ATPase subunit D
MAIIPVSCTRMNLLSIKKQVKTAKKGHKLLKDKRDGLMKEFMALIKDAKSQRKVIENKMGEAFLLLFEASCSTSPKLIESALYNSETDLSLSIKTKNVMSVNIPKLSSKVTGSAKNFSKTAISPFLPLSIEVLEGALPLLLQLAELEKAIELLSIEIEITRRRVNALEYKRIPDLEETAKFISLKLEEVNRDSVVSVMRVKAMIVKAEQEQEKKRKLSSSING